MYFSYLVGDFSYFMPRYQVVVLDSNSFCWAMWEERFVSMFWGFLFNLHCSRTCTCRRLDVVPSLRRTNIFSRVVLLFPYTLVFAILWSIAYLVLTCDVGVHLYVLRKFPTMGSFCCILCRRPTKDLDYLLGLVKPIMQFGILVLFGELV